MALSHHTLVTWQRADDLFVSVHRLSIHAFPRFERTELGSQLRRAAYSVAANVVEGFARPTGKARLNFLRIAQASLAEVGYCLHVAHRLGYVDDRIAVDLDVTVKQVGAPLAGLIRSTRAELPIRHRST